MLTAEYGSIAAAARASNLAPSLATRKIAQLEEALNARLLERTTRSVTLTEAGELVLGWAMQTLESEARLVDELGALQKNPTGLIRLAVSQYTAVAHLPALLAQFGTLYPKIRLSVTTTDRLVDLVKQHYDVAIHSGRVPDSSLIGQCISVFERVLCATPEYLERWGHPYAPGSLLSHHCLTHSNNETHNWFFKKDGKLISQPIVPYVESDSHSMILEMARKSMGIARLASVLVAKDIESGRLLQVMSDHQCVYPDGNLPGLWILYPNKRTLNRTRLLIDFLVENIKLE